jgi:hypothetical protein
MLLFQYYSWKLNSLRYYSWWRWHVVLMIPLFEYRCRCDILFCSVLTLLLFIPLPILLLFWRYDGKLHCIYCSGEFVAVFIFVVTEATILLCCCLFTFVRYVVVICCWKAAFCWFTILICDSTTVVTVPFRWFVRWCIHGICLLPVRFTVCSSYIRCSTLYRWCRYWSVLLLLLLLTVEWFVVVVFILRCQWCIPVLLTTVFYSRCGITCDCILFIHHCDAFCLHSLE